MPLPRREVQRQTALCPSLLFSAGTAKSGDQLSKWGYHLGLIPGIIARPLGNHDSLHPASKLTCPHCKWLKSTLLHLLRIYHRFTPPWWRAKHTEGLQVMSSFLGAVKSVLIHSNQRQISLLNDSGLPLVSRGLRHLTVGKSHLQVLYFKISLQN